VLFTSFKAQTYYAENRVKIRPVDVEIIGPTEIVKEERQDREAKHMAIR